MTKLSVVTQKVVTSAAIRLSPSSHHPTHLRSVSIILAVWSITPPTSSWLWGWALSPFAFTRSSLSPLRLGAVEIRLPHRLYYVVELPFTLSQLCNWALSPATLAQSSFVFHYTCVIEHLLQLHLRSQALLHATIVGSTSIYYIFL